MFKSITAAALASALLLLPAVIDSASAQTAPAPQTGTTKSDKAKPVRPVSPAQQALHERQKKCGAEWKAAKAAGKVAKGVTWPKYWSDCNKRLKAGG